MALRTTARRSLIALLATSALAATGAVAQATPVPHHPRVNEVNQRIDNQQQRIDKDQNGECRNGDHRLQADGFAQHQEHGAGQDAPAGRQHDQPVGGRDRGHDEGCGEIGGIGGHWRGGSCQ